MGLKQETIRPKTPAHRDVAYVSPFDAKELLLEARKETSRWQRYAAALEERVAPSVIAKIKKTIFG